MEEKLRISELKLQEVTNEKELYFSKLSSLDEFLNNALASDDAAQDSLLNDYLQKITTIIFNEDPKTVISTKFDSFID